MSDSANVTTDPPRRRSFSEKIAEKFTSLKARRNSGQSHHSDQSQHKHQYDTNDNAHDSAFAVEGSIVGAHAIPPIGLEHRYRTTASEQNCSQGKAAQQTHNDQAQAQAQAQSQAPVQTHADQQQTSDSSYTGDVHQHHHHTEGQMSPTDGLEDRLGGNDYRPLM
ncbi:hypothetical protein BG015_011815 [Linnemannia schmuckeri]|uniref:Uncharacterized protein n=1 Tax=Linnemannia schmuckeri TaxID=64567 RepID=A0A9P5V7M1_9FUNG|nr:hypothetical protein BG015_011815 [Linnemannia schmuckeri]